RVAGIALEHRDRFVGTACRVVRTRKLRNHAALTVGGRTLVEGISPREQHDGFRKLLLRESHTTSGETPIRAIDTKAGGVSHLGVIVGEKLARLVRRAR